MYKEKAYLKVLYYQTDFIYYLKVGIYCNNIVIGLIINYLICDLLYDLQTYLC